MITLKTPEDFFGCAWVSDPDNPIVDCNEMDAAWEEAQKLGILDYFKYKEYKRKDQKEFSSLKDKNKGTLTRKESNIKKQSERKSSVKMPSKRLVIENINNSIKKDNLYKLLDELKLDAYSGTFGRDGSYIIDLESDAIFGKVYTLLDNKENVYQREENTLLTTHSGSLLYDVDVDGVNYILNLKADFDSNQYSLVISEQ